MHPNEYNNIILQNFIDVYSNWGFYCAVLSIVAVDMVDTAAVACKADVVEDPVVVAWMDRNCNGDIDDHLAGAVVAYQQTTGAVTMAAESIPIAFVKML